MRNGSYGMKFKDKSQMFTYCEPVMGEEDEAPLMKDMVSHIPRDVSA